jgi:DNA invertase Pin-like site-specific DNA recombinase
LDDELCLISGDHTHPARPRMARTPALERGPQTSPRAGGINPPTYGTSAAALPADAHTRQFDVVLCWKVDRFGRSLKHLVNALADLDSYGVAFVSLRDNLDLSTPSGRLMFQIIGAMAEFERSLIQERVKAGLRNAILKGKTLGRPRRIVNGDQMARLREQGASLREIAKAVGASPGTVRTRLLCG